MIVSPTKERTEAEANQVHLPFEVKEEFFLEDIGILPRKPFYETAKRKFRLDELPRFWCALVGERGIIETTKKNADFLRGVMVNSISL